MTFPGFAGDPVKAWLLLPRGAEGPLPAVVEYNGYGGGRGLPHERLGWAASGYAYLFMDTRGQGSGWGSGGSTPDPHGSGPAAPGFMTRGIDDPADYYYRRVYTDAVRAIEAVRGLERVDAARVAVCGGSQGGGIALAAAGLTDGLVAVMPDVPFLCHFERAVGHDRHRPLRRDRAVPLRAPRSRGAGLRHAVVLRRREHGQARRRRPRSSPRGCSTRSALPRRSSPRATTTGREAERPPRAPPRHPSRSTRTTSTRAARPTSGPSRRSSSPASSEPAGVHNAGDSGGRVA